jgi:hypothetical protein
MTAVVNQRVCNTIQSFITGKLAIAGTNRNPGISSSFHGMIAKKRMAHAAIFYYRQASAGQSGI